jgi:hypothetical protein
MSSLAVLVFAVYAAWFILQNTVYSCNTSQQGTSGSIFAVFPAFTIDEVSCCAPLATYYNTSYLEVALSLFLQAGEEGGEFLTSQPTYQYDLVMLTSQVMSNYGIKLHAAANAAYLNKDLNGWWFSFDGVL